MRQARRLLSPRVLQSLAGKMHEACTRSPSNGLPGWHRQRLDSWRCNVEWGTSVACWCPTEHQQVRATLLCQSFHRKQEQTAGERRDKSNHGTRAIGPTGCCKKFLIAKNQSAATFQQQTGASLSNPLELESCLGSCYCVETMEAKTSCRVTNPRLKQTVREAISWEGNLFCFYQDPSSHCLAAAAFIWAPPQKTAPPASSRASSPRASELFCAGSHGFFARLVPRSWWVEGNQRLRSTHHFLGKTQKNARLTQGKTP